MEVGVVEGVDVGAEGEAEGVGEFARGVDGGDFGKVGSEGSETVRFDGALVHVGVIEFGERALVGAGGGIGFGGVFNNAGGLFEAEVGEDAEDAYGGTVGGELGLRYEASGGVEVGGVAGT